MHWLKFVDTLVKTAAGAVSEQDALAALERVDALDKAKPTAAQVGRYAGLGAVAGPVIGTVGRAIEGGGKLRPSARTLAADAAKGAITSGVIPLVRNNLDRHAEIGTLRKFVQQHEAQQAAAPAPM